MKNESKAYYLQVLGLSSNFNKTELKDAYRREAKKWHPDLNKDDIYAEERLQLINEAYFFLKNSRNNDSPKRKSSNSYSTNRTPKRESSSNVWSLNIIFSSKRFKKFIFYSGAFIAPFLSIIGISRVWWFGLKYLLAIPFVISALILGSIFFNWLNNYQINWYKKFGGEASESSIRNIARMWWYLSILIIAFFSFILISLVYWDHILIGPTNSEVESVKKTLAKGVEECRYRYKNNLSIRFRDAQAFSRKFDGFKIEPTISYRKIGNVVRRYKSTCFEAKATPLSDKNTWFRIKIDEFSFAQGLSAKYGGEKIKRSERFTQQSQGKCGDSSKPGCEKNFWNGNNSWSTDGFYRAFINGKL